MYDERFARQYRYEPPSEFPQNSTFTSIVHHLSGPNKYTHAQTSPNRSVGYWCKHLSSHFHYAHKFHNPQTRICVRLLGPCFKTGRREQFSHRLACQESDSFPHTHWCIRAPSRKELASTTSQTLAVGKWILRGTFVQPEPSYHVPRIILTLKQMVTHKARIIACIQIRTRSSICIGAAEHLHSTRQSHDAQLVPSAFLSTSSGTFNSLFKVLFIFPSWYLFAIGFKHIFSLRWNLPPNLRSNPEERDSWKECCTRRSANDKQDSHPQWFAFPSGFHLCPRWQHIVKLQFKARGNNLHVELIPVHSPLLRESYLVCFPPLTYMLKFSGFANLISCLECMRVKIVTASPKMPEHSQLQSTETSLGWPAHKCL